MARLSIPLSIIAIVCCVTAEIMDGGALPKVLLAYLEPTLCLIEPCFLWILLKRKMSLKPLYILMLGFTVFSLIGNIYVDYIKKGVSPAMILSDIDGVLYLPAIISLIWLLLLLFSRRVNTGVLFFSWLEIAWIIILLYYGITTLEFDSYAEVVETIGEFAGTLGELLLEMSICLPIFKYRGED